MRSTLTIDDAIMAELKKLANETNRSLKTVVNETLRAGLEAGRTPQPGRFRIEAASLGEAAAGVDLDKALRLAAGLEDEELAWKLEQRS